MTDLEAEATVNQNVNTDIEVKQLDADFRADEAKQLDADFRAGEVIKAIGKLKNRNQLTLFHLFLKYLLIRRIFCPQYWLIYIWKRYLSKKMN